MMEGLNFEPFLRASPACTDCMSVQVLVVIAHLSLALKDTLMLGVKLQKIFKCVHVSIHGMLQGKRSHFVPFEFIGIYNSFCGKPFTWQESNVSKLFKDAVKPVSLGTLSPIQNPHVIIQGTLLTQGRQRHVVLRGGQCRTDVDVSFRVRMELLLFFFNILISNFF